MPASKEREGSGSRLGFREKLKRFGFRGKHEANESPKSSSPASRDGNVTVTSNSIDSKPESVAVVTLLAESNGSPPQPTPAWAPKETVESEPKPEQHPAKSPGLELNIKEIADLPSDLWSAAYREAVLSLGDEINVAILKGESVAELFKQLENLEKDTAQESLFLRGVKHLKSLQVPLEKFKIALDLASPLTNIEPTVSTVFGIVQGVTAVAITFASVDIGFANQIGEMLKQLSYIDDCDTLGQKTNKENIHKALVAVYGKLLEFYSTAFEMLSKKGAKLAWTLVVNNGKLPEIVTEFLKHAEFLRKLVENATLEIANEIRSMLFDQEIAQWLGSDKISRQSQHHVNLKDLRSDQACEFLLKHGNFTNWYQATGSDCRHLAILGHMGSGKSVCMAYLIDELRRRNQHLLPQPKVCYHYCQNDGSGQAVYVFSSLILSLLEQLPGLKRGFYEWHRRTAGSGIDPATSFKALEEWLEQAVEDVDRPLTLVVDGLDECDRQSRNTLLKSLRRLSEKTRTLRILLASRPEEEIVEQLGAVSTIAMPSDAERDRLIVEKTVDHRLSYLSPNVKTHVIETLSAAAQGSPIWIKMTVDLIEIRNIRALGPMKVFLKEIPQAGKLSELYSSLFSRYTLDDPENQRLATTALEVLAATKRPLSILELAWAVTLGTMEENVATVEALSEFVDHQRIMTLIQPFVVQVDFSDLKKRQVKLAHQSAKEFVIDHWASNRPGAPNGIKSTVKMDQAAIQQRIETLEANLLGICIKYLLLQDMDHLDLFSEDYTVVLEMPHDPFASDDEDEDEPATTTYDMTWENLEAEMIHYDPANRGFGEFFVYAASLWPEHYAAVSIESLFPSLEDIELLCHTGSKRLQNWTAQFRRPNSAIKTRFDWDDSNFDPLLVTSLYGSDAMLQHMLSHSDFDKPCYRPNPARNAAKELIEGITTGLTRIKILWNSKLGHEIQNEDFFLLAVRTYSRYSFDRSRPGWDVVFGLTTTITEQIVAERWGNGLLTVAARSACMPLIQTLLTHAQSHPALRSELLDDVRYRNGPLGEAIWCNHVDVLEYLLAQPGIEPHLRHRSADGENLLHLAAKNRNPAVYRLLAPRMRDVIHERDENNGDTPLMLLIVSPAGGGDLYASARVLLEEGGAEAKRDGGGGGFEEEMQDALRVAEEVGDGRMGELLKQFMSP